MPGETYTWTVTVDGVSSDNWTFTVSDKIHPLNDRSVDISAVDEMLVPTHNKSLDVAENVVSFLRFDIPSSVDLGGTINLNITPEQIESLDGGIVLYKYNYQSWGEKFNENNLGVIAYKISKKSLNKTWSSRLRVRVSYLSASCSAIFTSV